MEQELFNYLQNAEFEKAANFLRQVNNVKIKEMLLTIAYESESIVCIGFSSYMFQISNNYFWYDCIVSLLLNPLCFIEGSYSLAYHYSKETLKHERSEDNLVQMLFFNEIPEKLLADAEALSIAKEVIALNPNNEVAQKYIQYKR